MENTTAIKVTVTPGTVYVSAQGLKSYANLTFTFTNEGPPVSLSRIGIQLPENFYSRGDFATIVPQPDRDKKWNFVPQGTDLLATPAKPGTVDMAKDVSFTLGINHITLADAAGIVHYFKVRMILKDAPEILLSLPVSMQVATARIDSFSARPDLITRGENSTLSWATTGIDYCMISPGEPEHLSASGSLNVKPNATEFYTLYAYASGVILSSMCGVTVGNVQIVSFVSEKELFNYGETIRLSWVCNRFVKRVGITCTDPSVVIPTTLDINGSATFGPITRSCSFQLNAFGESDTNKTSLVCIIVLRPPTGTFRSNKTECWDGENVTIDWDLQSVSSVRITPPLPGNTNPSLQTLKGSVTFVPSASVKYALTYEGFVSDGLKDPKKQMLGRIQSTTIEIDLKADTSRVDEFSVTPSPINAETNPNQVTLSWKTSGQVIEIDNGIGKVATTGNKVITNPADGTVYKLSAGTSANPGKVKRELTLNNSYGPFRIESLGAHPDQIRFKTLSFYGAMVVIRRVSGGDLSWLPLNHDPTAFSCAGQCTLTGVTASDSAGPFTGYAGILASPMGTDKSTTVIFLISCNPFPKFSQPASGDNTRITLTPVRMLASWLPQIPDEDKPELEKLLNEKLRLLKV